MVTGGAMAPALPDLSRGSAGTATPEYHDIADYQWSTNQVDITCLVPHY
jgi:hypothetical protein